MWETRADVLSLVRLQNQKAKRKVIFKRADEYVKEYTAQEKEEIRLKRAARASGDFYVEAQPKVYFVVRLKGWVKFFMRLDTVFFSISSHFGSLTLGLWVVSRNSPPSPVKSCNSSVFSKSTMVSLSA